LNSWDGAEPIRGLCGIAIEAALRWRGATTGLPEPEPFRNGSG
jgi:hypothetical protein